MSASTTTVPAQMGFGRLPLASAALALLMALAIAVAIVALGSTKAGTPDTTSGFGHGPGDWYYTTTVDSGAKGAPPPAFHDSDVRTEMYAAPGRSLPGQRFRAQ